MKRIIMLICVCFCLSNSYTVFGEEKKPDYEKFGRIAIAVVKEDYPGEPVYEYKYQGRTKASGYNVTDSFLFLVKEGEQSVKVIVQVSHNSQNNKFVTLTVKEQK